MARKPIVRHNLFLVEKIERAGESETDDPELDYSEFLNPEGRDAYDPYDFDKLEGVVGRAYIRTMPNKAVDWKGIVSKFVDNDFDQLLKRSSSAVLFFEVDEEVYALTLGYGRHMLNLDRMVTDFGLKTALNTLDHKTLRSVDSFTIEDQPVQKRTQASRESEVAAFGIDVTRDILKSITGKPREGVKIFNIFGSGPALTFSTEAEIEDLPRVCKDVFGYYQLDRYKEEFDWVDNVRRVKEKALIDWLDNELVDAVWARKDGVSITLPEIIEWDKVVGFSFTGKKKLIRPYLEIEDYYSTLDRIDELNLEILKRHRLHIFDVDETGSNQSVYKCLYFEILKDSLCYTLFGGTWYEVNKDFKESIEEDLSVIEEYPVRFPRVESWEEDSKPKIEAEGDYNERAAAQLGYYLLDKKNIKSSKTTSAVELCDLLTPNGHFIHVKHRKGGSASLSHLFAQGSVSANLVLGDKEFRKKARVVLRGVDSRAERIVPLNDAKGSDYTVVFLILGEESSRAAHNLPFFSKVNLTNTYNQLVQKGFKVQIAGVPRVSVVRSEGKDQVY